VRPYVASQALGQERLYDIARTPGEKGKQLAEDSLDRYSECGEGQEILVTDAHLIRSSQFNTDLEVLSLEEIEHIDVGETGDKLVVRVAHASESCFATHIINFVSVQSCLLSVVVACSASADPQKNERRSCGGLLRCRGDRGAVAGGPAVRPLIQTVLANVGCRVPVLEEGPARFERGGRRMRRGMRQ
jgi:hypothetical protein